MRQKIGELHGQKEYAQAAKILEWGLEQFPDHRMANTYNLATFQVLLDQPKKALQTLLSGLDHGLWYGPWDFEADLWESVKELDGFEQVNARSEMGRKAAQAQAKPELTVITPTNYDPQKKYPLFIALHGGGETVAAFQPQWTSPKLKTDFIVAYPQCSRVISMNGFCWMGEPQDRTELIDAYQKVLADYAIDTENIIMGGFSAGGHQTLTLLLEEEQAIPLRGFVVLCPPIPEDYSPEAVDRIRERGQRGLLLTTELDGRVEEQRQFAQTLEQAGVPIQFSITPNIGHWYPTDLADRIDQAIEFILTSKDV